MSKTLLGTDKDGLKYYLADPSWDCGWYWGYGYIQSQYSHQHADGKFYDDASNSDYNIFTGSFLKEKTFTESQGWKIRELMATFYQLKHQAELVGRGGMHVTTNPLADMLKDEKEAKRINEVLIPAITAEIKKIFSEGK